MPDKKKPKGKKDSKKDEVGAVHLVVGRPESLDEEGIAKFAEEFVKKIKAAAAQQKERAAAAEEEESPQ